jgi:hypothetical protein
MAFDWRALLGTVAPGIATALGGPLAGMAVQAIGAAFGMDPGATQETVAAKLAGATPADMLALKQAEEKFQVDMRALEIDLEKTVIRADVDDRASARAREVSVRDWIPGLLAMLITAGFFGVLTYMLRFGLSKDGGGEALLVMLGSLGTAWISVVAYYFGSSAGSERKTATIANMAQKERQECRAGLNPGPWLRAAGPLAILVSLRLQNAGNRV